MPTTDPRTVLDAYKAAVYAKDVDAFMSLYDPAIRVYDMWDRWAYDGADAWRGMAEGWFGSLGSDRVVVDFDDVQAVATGEMAVLAATVTFTGTSEAGEALRSLKNRLTMVCRLEDDAWKVVHEHTSAPVGFGTGKLVTDH